MIYAVTVYYYLDPKLGLIVRKRLASLGMESLEARWSSSSKRISEVKGYSDWSYNGFFFFTLVTLALSELEETHTGVMTLERNISVLCSYQSYCGQEYTQGHIQALR